MHAPAERRLHGSPSENFRSTILSSLSICTFRNLKLVNIPQRTLRAANESRWLCCIVVGVDDGTEKWKFCGGYEDDESGGSGAIINDAVDVYVAMIGVQKPRPAPQTKETNYIGSMVTHGKVTLKTYKAHLIVTEGFGIVSMCWTLTVCEKDCVADIKLTEMLVSSVLEFWFVDDDKLTNDFSATR